MGPPIINKPDYYLRFRFLPSLTGLAFGTVAALGLLASPALLSAQSSQKELDQQILGEQGEATANPKSSSWTLHGFVENESHLHINENADFVDNGFVKFENRLRLDAKAGSDFFYGRVIGDLYYYPQREDYKPEGYAPPQPNGSGELYQAYVHIGERVQFRAGKQHFDWGKADVFQVTDYMERADLREGLAKDQEDQATGVYALSLKYIWRTWSIQAVFRPLFSQALYPRQKSFWQIVPDKQSITVPESYQASLGEKITLPVEWQTGSEPSPTWKNSNVALRLGGTTGALDIYLSYYHGQDNRLGFQPETTIKNLSSDPEVTHLRVTPFYRTIDSVGLESAFNISSIAIRAEANYTPNKWGLRKGEYNQQGELPEDITLTGKLDQEHHIAYTVGVDAQLWRKHGRILVEWSQSYFLQNRDSYEKEFISDLILLRLEDKFWDEHVHVELGSMIRPEKRNHIGVVPMASVTYDFHNGMELELGTMMFYANGESLVGLFDDNDFAYIRGRYTF